MFILFFVVTLLLFAADLFFHRKEKENSLYEAMLWTLLWILLALLFNLFLYFEKGGEAALAFFTGYIVEKGLSIDNLFVFLLIFRTFKTPAHLIRPVLFWGILGAIVMRIFFISIGITLIGYFHWIFYLLGAFLIYKGIDFFFEKKTEKSFLNNPLLKLFPITPEYEGKKFFVRKMGRLFATPLFITLLAIESSDLIFAIDSIPVILGITLDPLIIFTSNIFAILGLRALYFVIAPLIDRFWLLHYGLAFILIFIGCKMLLTPWFTIPIYATLLLLLLVFSLSLLLSAFFPKKKID